MEKRYNDYSSHMRSLFNERVQKVSIDAGFSCPNRDGTKGVGGCTFCNNSTFNPEYCSTSDSITHQIDTGIGFFAHKYKTQRYLAYFQAYSNTYANIDVLKERYTEALNHPKVIGLVIGTRPDCISTELLDYLAELSKKYYVCVEYGVESTLDSTLLEINRGHTFGDSIDAISATAERNIKVGAHLILGLPNENYNEIILHATRISVLPLNYLKIHQLQIVKGSAMGANYLKNPDQFELYTAEEYIDLVIDFIEYLDPKIIIERFISQAPPDLLIAPKWGLKNFEFVAKVEKRLKERDTKQGAKY